MIVSPRPFPPFRPRSTQRGAMIVPVAAPADVRDLRLPARSMRPHAVWTIDKASGRPVCLWESAIEQLGRGEDEEAQRRSRRHARPRALVRRGRLRFRAAPMVIKASRG